PKVRGERVRAEEAVNRPWRPNHAGEEARAADDPPSFLSFGKQDVGATRKGSLQALGATSCGRHHTRTSGDGPAAANRPGPSWIELKGPTKTGQDGLAWTFTVRTDRPGDYFTSIAFECDSGVGYCQVHFEVAEGAPALGELVLCDSPFDCHTTFESLASLLR